MTKAATVDLKSPAEHLEMLKKHGKSTNLLPLSLERKCCKLSFPDAQKEQEEIQERFQQVREYLLYNLAIRQAKHPDHLLVTDEFMLKGPRQGKSYKAIFKERAAKREPIFRPSTFDEQMIANALMNRLAGCTD